jgi:hypothetical protein
MPSSYTTSLRLTLPATGELSGTWGSTVNTGITELLDAAVAGTTTISTWGGAGVPYTLSNNSGTADEARRMFIVATGTPGEAKNVICPAVSKMYVFRNDTTGGFALTLKTSGGTGIAVPAGQYKFLYCDGTNVVDAFNSAGALTLSGALSVGGTSTLSALTASQAVFTNGSKALVSNAITGTGNVVMSTSPTLVTPVLGAATATSVNGLTVSSTTGTLTLANGSTLATSGANSLTMTTTGATNVTFPTSGTLATTGGTVASFSAGSTGFTPNTATTGAVTLAGTLATTNGGTGLTSFTANGVVYASSTSALTTGSALTFDGTTLVAGAAAARVQVSPSTNTNTSLFQATNAGGSGYFGLDSSTGGLSGAAYALALWHNSNYPIVFGVNNAEQMRLTSTGLGIGTSSPVNKLVVSNAGAQGFEFDPANGIIQTYNRSVSAYIDMRQYALSMRFFTGSSPVETMRLDSSGNLGLGVTPSAWNSTSKALQVSTFVSVSQQASGAANFGFNFYEDAANAFKYISTDEACRFSALTDGGFGFFTAPSGTAGNSISFTQAMTLDASGNLLLGTTTQKVTQFGGAATGMTIGGASYPVLALWDTADASYNFMLAQDGGTAFVFNNANGPLTFSTNATERARITSGGDLLVGTTDAAQTSGVGFKVGGAGGIGVGQVAVVDTDSTNSTVTYRLYSTGAAAYRFYVGLGGTIYATSATITSLSDQRLKDNIQDIDVGLNAVMALKPRKFDWKAGKGKDKKNDRGWIAQEFEQVFPDMVDTWQDPAPEGEEPYKAVNADLIPVLVKAIQEQQAIITDLRARVAALEA